MNIRFWKGRSLPPEVGVVAVLFCHDMSHLGSSRWKYDTKCCCVVVWPGVPGTRGMRIGARRSPCSWSKRSPGAGMAFKKLSESGLYACVDVQSRYVRIEREDGRERSIVAALSKEQDAPMVIWLR